jgi:hypothetical protein
MATALGMREPPGAGKRPPVDGNFCQPAASPLDRPAAGADLANGFGLVSARIRSARWCWRSSGPPQLLERGGERQAPIPNAACGGAPTDPSQLRSAGLDRRALWAQRWLHCCAPADWHLSPQRHRRAGSAIYRRFPAVQPALRSPVPGVPFTVRSWRPVSAHPAHDDGQMTVRRS